MSQTSSFSFTTFGGALVLVGAGKMGEALLAGWLERGINPRQVVIFEPAPSAELRDLASARMIRLNPKIADIQDTAVLVLALKPQIMADVLPLYTPLAHNGALVLSIAAGRPIRFFEQYFTGAPIVRAMPNSPAAIAKGVTVLCASMQVSDPQREFAAALMGAVGVVSWIKDESLMDAVTAVSGSGPAYVFLLIEALANAGVKAGLDADLANLLARQTVIGAAALAGQSGQSAAILRENVTSPGGTTAAALGILMGPDGLQRLMDEAIAAATERGRALAK